MIHFKTRRFECDFGYLNLLLLQFYELWNAWPRFKLTVRRIIVQIKVLNSLHVIVQQH